jgi:hypothetical protein
MAKGRVPALALCGLVSLLSGCCGTHRRFGPAAPAYGAMPALPGVGPGGGGTAIGPEGTVGGPPPPPYVVTAPRDDRHRFGPLRALRGRLARRADQRHFAGPPSVAPAYGTAPWPAPLGLAAPAGYPPWPSPEGGAWSPGPSSWNQAPLIAPAPEAPAGWPVVEGTTPNVATTSPVGGPDVVARPAPPAAGPPRDLPPLPAPPPARDAGRAVAPPPAPAAAPAAEPAPAPPPGLAGRVPPGMRAATIEVDDTSIRPGLIRPGARVDVVQAVEAEPGGRVRAETVLEDVRVLAIGATLIRPGARDSSVVTLALTPEQERQLSAVRSRGPLSLSLRGEGDRAAPERRGEPPARPEPPGRGADAAAPPPPGAGLTAPTPPDSAAVTFYRGVQGPPQPQVAWPGSSGRADE